MDYLSLKAAVAEAGKRYTGSRIRNARQLSGSEIEFLFDHEAALVLSINPSRPGLFLVDPEPSCSRIRTPFSELLNTRIDGTTMVSLQLPEPGERLVNLDFKAGWPARSGHFHRIILEIMGQHSNLMMVHEGIILQPLKVVPASKSRLRPVFPGERWEPPPQRPGIAIEHLTPEDLPIPSDTDGVEALLQAVRGLSPYTAGQALRRAADGSRQTLHRALTSMTSLADGEKGFVHRTGKRSYLAPFEPVVGIHGETCELFRPFSSASAVWREEGPHVNRTGKDHETHRLADDLRRREQELLLALKMLDRQLERCRTHPQVRIMAETLLIHASEVAQGKESVMLPNPYEPEEKLNIPLFPSKSVLENAERMFTEAHRLKRGVEETSERKKGMEKELSNVRRSLDDIVERGDPALAKTLLDTESVRQSDREPGTFRAYRGPGKRFIAGDFTILVGRNARDNERVTFQAAGPHDLWLHARDYPGSHVVILTQKKKVPDEVLYRAAELAAEGSGAKNENAPEVMVTERKWVRKLGGGKPGKVTVERFRTIRPRMQEPESRSRKKK